jgi:RNA polymerase sigma-70 factor, ECF subfamily
MHDLQGDRALLGALVRALAIGSSGTSCSSDDGVLPQGEANVDAAEHVRHLLVAAAELSIAEMENDAPVSDGSLLAESARRTLWTALSAYDSGYRPAAWTDEDRLHEIFIGCAENCAVSGEEDCEASLPPAEEIRTLLATVAIGRLDVNQPERDDSVAAASGQPWAKLVEQIQNDDPQGMDELYRVFSMGVRYSLCRQLGPQDLDDRVYDVFLIIAQAIRRGDLREPERLMGYVRTVVRRQVAAHIGEGVHSRGNETDIESGTPIADRATNPEPIAIEREHEELAMKMLRRISKRDREILVRFYLEDQSQSQICREMQLTETQFRLIKSRAKARFGELGRQRLARGKVPRWYPGDRFA